MKSSPALPATGIFVAIAVFLPQFLIASPENATGASPKRPNILFLFADDQRADSISAWGNRYIRTPAIDSLVERGFSFRTNYCMGSMHGAVCIPSRAMLNSGRSLYHIRMDLRGTPIMPEVFRRAGYLTFGTGKWHNGKESFLRGFEQGKAVFFGGMSDHFKVPVYDVEPGGTLINQRIGSMHSSQLFAQAAIEFLRSYRGNRPFYAYVAFTAPHDPRDPPLPYRKYYYAHRPPLPANFMPQHPFNNGNLIGRDENLAPWPRTPEIISDQLSEYYGLITHLDEQIGRILRVLKERGLDRNTIIVYAADHGLALGSHGLLGKQSIYEHSMRCPLIFAGPGIRHGSSEAFTYLLDVFPTLCRLTGVSAPPEVEGKDLSSIWKGEKTAVRDSVYLTFAKHMRSIRKGRWKLIRYPHINYTQLFDLQKDPYELHNLADRKDQAQRIRSLTALLRAWQKKVGDGQPLSTDKPQRFKIDLTGHRRRPDKWQPAWIRRKYFGVE